MIIEFIVFDELKSETGIFVWDEVDLCYFFIEVKNVLI